MTENTVMELMEGYREICKPLSLEDLYREQDRILRAIPRLNTIRPVPPMKLLDLLERKLIVLETLIDERYEKYRLTKPDVPHIV